MCRYFGGYGCPLSCQVTFCAHNDHHALCPSAKSATPPLVSIHMWASRQKKPTLEFKSEWGYDPFSSATHSIFIILSAIHLSFAPKALKCQNTMQLLVLIVPWCYLLASLQGQVELWIWTILICHLKNLSCSCNYCESNKHWVSNYNIKKQENHNKNEMGKLQELHNNKCDKILECPSQTCRS